MGILVSGKKSKLGGVQKEFWAIVVISLFVILCAGLASSVSVGDEVHHYRFAKSSYILDARATYDVAYSSPERPGYYFSSEVGWPLPLSWLWKLTGGPSSLAAQLYHAAYFLLLVFSTFFLAKKLYEDEVVAFFSAMLVSTMPMIASFSILFYIDMPVTAVSVFGAYLLLDKRYWLFGIVLGWGYLVKRSAVFFAPGIALYLIVICWRHVGTFFKTCLKIGLPLLCFVIPEHLWRNSHLLSESSAVRFVLLRTNMHRLLDLDIQPVAQAKKLVSGPMFKPSHMGDYAVSSIFDPVDIIKYFGVVLMALLAIYFFRRKFSKRDMFLWMLIGSFVMCNFMLKLVPDIRYMMPVVPIAAILAASVFVRSETFSKRKVQVVIFLICTCQLVGASYYTHTRRTIPNDLKRGFEYIKEEIPEKKLILYPEANLIEYTGRPMVWSRILLRQVLWGSEEAAIDEIVSNQIEYIVIKKDRIYNDEGIVKKHVGAYPISFVKMLKTWKYAENIYENEAITVYRMKMNLMKEFLNERFPEES